MAKDLSSMAGNNKSYMAKSGEVESKWYLVDATDMILGRLASQVASILRGKNKPTYTPSVDTGDHVIIINCAKVKLSGKKLEKKYYRHNTLFVGGMKEMQYKILMAKKPEFAVALAIKGMCPKNCMGDAMQRKLRVYAGSEYDNEAQKPEKLVLTGHVYEEK